MEFFVTGYGPDKLEMCIAQFLKHQNQRPLQEYAAQHVRVNSEQSYVGRDEVCDVLT